jgi:hypothetical protein
MVAMRTDRFSSQRSGTVDRIGDGLLFDMPPDQMERHVGAISDWPTKYRVSASMGTGLPDEDRFRDWYQAFLLSYECLLEHGYPVFPPLSEDAWSIQKELFAPLR